MRDFYRLFLAVAAALVLASPASAQTAEKPAGSATESPTATGMDNWSKVKGSVFRDRTINPGADRFVELITPVRAEDAAVVPIGIKTKLEQSTERYIKRLYLIIDRNPAPIAATFHMTPDTGRADMETRVRIEEYTDVRVVVEMNDDRLYTTSRYVKASGGCSAPAGKDAAAAAANLGKMKLTLEDVPELNKPALAQLMIRHPNTSGLAMDQVTRMYAPPHYVRRVDVTYNGKQIMSADTDISISENPNFRFYIVPTAEGKLAVEATDSNDMVFKTSLQVKPN